MKTVYWTRERIAEMQGYAEQGLQAHEIAVKFNKTTTAIRKQANKFGVTITGQFNIWSDAEDRLLREMAADGFGWQDIARRLPGRNVNAVIGYARRNNIKFLGKRGPKPCRYAKPVQEKKSLPKRKCLYRGCTFTPSHRFEFSCPACKSSKPYQTSGSAFA